MLKGIFGRLLGGSKTKIQDYQNEYAARQLEEVQHLYNQMRAFRHDMHSHLQTLQALADMGDIQEVAGYVQRLDESLRALDTVIRTGNVKMDAVINPKLSLARSQGVQVSANALAPARMQVSDVDLCVLLGNLIDNAHEACLKTSEPWMRLYIVPKRSQLYISMTNSAPEKVALMGKVKSSKSGFHGFGLGRMDMIVKKYGGYINRRSEKNVFSTEILLPME